MRKFLSILIITTLLIGLYVSCSSDVEEETIAQGLCSVNFETQTKGLQVVVDSAFSSSGTDAFYWKYQATKQDSYGKEGETTTLTEFKKGETGLRRLEDLSTGKWTFEIRAYLDD